MVTELGGAQISSLMETLPGIAQVLRSPVADAFVTLIRQASRHADFQIGSAEEVLRFSVRRNLMSADESERILADLREAMQRRAERAEAKKPPAAKAAAKPAAPRAVAKPKPRAAALARKTKAPARPVRAAPRKKAPARKR